jgi:hypothetical protein
VRLERRDGYWVCIGGPVPPGAAAMTFGSLVLVRAAHAGNAHLLRHELVHVDQYRRHGIVGFLTRYLWWYGVRRAQRYPHWAAYRRIPFEIDAEWQARRATVRATVPATR